jgi:hypothetical protein
VQVEVRIVRRELDDLPQSVLRAAKRAVESEGHRAVRHKLQRVVVDLELRAFLRTSRDQAYRRKHPLARLSQPNVVRPRQPAAHQHAPAGRAHIGVVRRAARHGQVQLAVLQDLRPAAIPAAYNIGNPLAQ